MPNQQCPRIEGKFLATLTNNKTSKTNFINGCINLLCKVDYISKKQQHHSILKQHIHKASNMTANTYIQQIITDKIL